DLFSPRQALALVTLARLVREAGERMKRGERPTEVVSGPSGAMTAASKGAAEGRKVVSERSQTISEGRKVVSERSQMISERSQTTLERSQTISERSKMTLQRSKMTLEGTKVVAEGAPTTSESRRTSLPPTSGRQKLALSGLQADSEDDRSDNSAEA